MILYKLKATGFMLLAITLTVLLGWQTWRLHTAQIELADTLVTLATEHATAANALTVAQGEHREKEQFLNTSAAQTRKTTNEKLLVLATQHNSLLERVHLAEARASDPSHSQVSTTSSDGSVASVGDGPELLGSLGAADVEEATRADTIRVHLKACYADYNRAAEALSK